MLPLSLSVKPGAWRLFTMRKADPAFRKFQTKVLERDNYTCQFCGFQAKDYQEVVNVDNNYQHNKLSNMATACCFCTQCFFLEAVGAGDYGGGTLVYLPEISQGELNSFCHVIFCAITNDTGYKASAQSLYRSLKFRSQVIEKKFTEGAEQPAMFGQLLIDAGLKDEEISKILKDLRLLPSRAKFRKQIEHWAASALEALAENTEDKE
ncbi:MAG: type IVB secretion system protein IcmJDotN [Gammaproteobacteria bacterium]